MISKEKAKSKYMKAAQEYAITSNCTVTYLANKYGIDRGRLSAFFKKQGITVTPKARSKQFADKLDEAINHYVVTGEGIIRTASQFNISHDTLRRILKQRGLTRNEHTAVHYAVNDHYFSVIDTEDKAYWFGFLLADACIRYQLGCAQITLELANQDYIHLQKFKDDLNFTGPIHTRSNRNISCVRITRLKMANDLSAKGCVQDKTHKGWIDLDSIIDFESHFIRGYCDGNGCIDKKRYRITFVMGSKAIAEGLMILLQKYGPIFKQEKYLSNAGNPTYRVSIQNKSGFYQFLEDVYLHATVYLNRKMFIALQRLEAHYGQMLSEDHRKIMRNLAETTLAGESETEGSATSR